MHTKKKSKKKKTQGRGEGTRHFMWIPFAYFAPRKGKRKELGKWGEDREGETDREVKQNLDNYRRHCRLLQPICEKQLVEKSRLRGNRFSSQRALRAISDTPRTARARKQNHVHEQNQVDCRHGTGGEGSYKRGSLAAKCKSGTRRGGQHSTRWSCKRQLLGVLGNAHTRMKIHISYIYMYIKFGAICSLRPLFISPYHEEAENRWPVCKLEKESEEIPITRE